MHCCQGQSLGGVTLSFAGYSANFRTENCAPSDDRAIGTSAYDRLGASSCDQPLSAGDWALHEAKSDGRGTVAVGDRPGAKQSQLRAMSLRHKWFVAARKLTIEFKACQRFIFNQD